MRQDQPLVLIGMIALTGVLAKWWLGDYRAARRQPPAPRAFPGATPASRTAIFVAVMGSLILLAVETGGESALGLTHQQSRLTWLFGAYTLAAAFTEELIFRGYLVIAHRERWQLIASILGASLLFALLHPFLWSWSDDRLATHFTERKAWFSTILTLAGSLWFYTVRFMPLNPGRSLLPCIAAHIAKNVGVIAVKYAQGYMSGWW